MLYLHISVHRYAILMIAKDKEYNNNNDLNMWMWMCSDVALYGCTRGTEHGRWWRTFTSAHTRKRLMSK